MLALCLSLALDLGLAGCGQKGPLYLPAPSTAPKPAPSRAPMPPSAASTPSGDAARP